jgi:hypothetical protein
MPRGHLLLQGAHTLHLIMSVLIYILKSDDMDVAVT